MIANSPLTPVIQIDTKVPAPNRSFASVDSDPGKLFGDGNRTIQLNACSEFVNEPTSLKSLDGDHKLRIIQDASSNPAIFTRGSDSRLYCTVHVEGGQNGWQVVDITPIPESRGGVTSFDVMKTIDNRVVICTAFSDLSGAIAVYHCTIPDFSCSWNADTKALVGLDPKRLPWKRIENNLGPKPVSNLSLAPSPSASPPFQILAMTKSTDKYVASHFVLDPIFGAKVAWKHVNVGASVSVVRESYPANLFTGRGLFTLFDYPDGTSGCVFDSIDNAFHYKMRLDDFGNIRSIYSNQNPWNMTDLLAATEHGVAFCNFAAPDMPPQFVLAGIGIKQVVSYEALDKDGPDIQTKLAIFALSDNNELYYVEAWRPYATNVLRFRTSGLPMASNVARVSTQYNATQDATEVIYLGDGTDEIYHVARTATGWAQNRIMVKHTENVKIVRIPSYVTSLTLVSDLGISVGGDYPVLLSSKDLVRVTVNGRSRTIGPTAAPFLTDGDGRIRIVAVTDSSLVGPEYNLTLTKFTGQPRSFPVHSAQRVLRIMAKVDSTGSLANAKSTDGRTVFNASDPKLGDSAALLTNFHSMVSSVDPAMATQVLAGIGKPNKSGDMSIGYARQSDGSTLTDVGSWIDEAVEALDHAIADVMAFVRKAVKVVAKFAIKVVGPVVTFFFKIAGKAIKFVAKHAWTLLQGVAHFLDEYLGLHLTDFLNWLSYIFDVESTKETQKVFLEMFTVGKDLVDAQMQKWGDSIDSVIEDARTSASQFIKDDRPQLQPNGTNPLEPFNSPVFNKCLDFFFNNPIASTIQKYNPVMLLMDAIEGGVEDALAESDYTLDLAGRSVWTKLIEIIADFFEQEKDNFQRLITEIAQRCEAVVADFSRFKEEVTNFLGDAFWTMFDAIKILVVQLWKLITALIDAIMDLIRQEVKIPLIADLWEEFAEQPFTLWNVSTYVCALVLNIISQSTTGKLPFEAWGDPRPSMRKLVNSTRARSKVDIGSAPHIKATQDGIHTADVSDSEQLKNGEQQWQKWADYTNLIVNVATLVSGLMGTLEIANKSGSAAAQKQERMAFNKEVQAKLDGKLPGERQPLIPKRNQSGITEGWARLFQNIQFGCDAFQILAQVVAIAAYSDLCGTNTPFKDSQTPSFGVQVAIQNVMLVTAIMDCGARGVCAVVDRNPLPAESNNAVGKFTRSKWTALKAVPEARREGVCDAVASLNCFANVVGFGVSTGFSARDGGSQASQAANGLGTVASFCTGVANGTGAGMKISDAYPTPAVVVFAVGLVGGTLGSLGQMVAAIDIVAGVDGIKDPQPNT